MFLYRIYDNTREYSFRGGIRAAIIAAESEEEARNVVIEDDKHGEHVQLNTPDYTSELLGFCSTVKAGVVLVDYDYDYLDVTYDWHKECPTDND